MPMNPANEIIEPYKLRNKQLSEQIIENTAIRYYPDKTESMPKRRHSNASKRCLLQHPCYLQICT